MAMTWWTLGLGCGVLELNGASASAGSIDGSIDGEAAALELELVVWWGDGRARAAWVSSQTGRVLSWARVGSG